jgi:hypothetical protein
VISDCEGFERELFSEADAGAGFLDVIVEVHDNLTPAPDPLRERFARTHDVSVITEAELVTPDVNLEFLSPEEARAAAREIRGPQEWLLLTPRSC